MSRCSTLTAVVFSRSAYWVVEAYSRVLLSAVMLTRCGSWVSISRGMASMSPISPPSFAARSSPGIVATLVCPRGTHFSLYPD
ncbi:hypothetical protein D9M71_727250 [compost metagenome]